MARFPLLLLSVVAALAQQQDHQRDFSREKEIALGRAVVADLRRQSPPVEDALISAYLGNLVERLNVRAQSPFAIAIDLTRELDQRQVTVLPGGFLQVPVGLIAGAGSEAELAAALAHGLAHVVSRHGVRDAMRGQAAGLSTIPLIFIAHAVTHGRAQGLLIPVGFEPFQRQAEIEADTLTAHWMSEGVEPSGEFPAVQERARAFAAALAPPPRLTPPPPTLRRKGEQPLPRP